MTRPVGPIPGLINRQSINLLIGSPSSGKTQLLFSQLDDYAGGKGFLEIEQPEGTSPVQLGVISASRSLNNLLYTVAPFPNISSQQTFPIEVWKPEASFTDYQALVAAWQNLSAGTRDNRPVKLLVVEGLQKLMQSNKPNDSKLAGDFCADLQKFCTEKDVAVIGTVGTAKMKKGDYYPLLADRVFGASTWAHEAETLIGIERTELHRPAGLRPSLRRVIIQAQDSAERVLYADFDDEGRLRVVTMASMDQNSATDQALDDRLWQEKPGAVFRKPQLDEWGEQLEKPISPRRVLTWISSRLELGLLEKKGNTSSLTYHKPFTQ